MATETATKMAIEDAFDVDSHISIGQYAFIRMSRSRIMKLGSLESCD
jgi:hypothetical protein